VPAVRGRVETIIAAVQLAEATLRGQTLTLAVEPAQHEAAVPATRVAAMQAVADTAAADMPAAVAGITASKTRSNR